ncbi:MAG TPA: hypothetical protein VMZ69_04075 [Saprospiraceae bacterium]|nr:hypothetical protein [Saprospiraceae bacterium]
MNRLIYYSVIGLFFTPLFLTGQTATEAFRYSLFDPTGTARNLGTGNSMFAIGPDFSAFASNPSGLGGYRKSEFLFTAGLGINNFNSAFSEDQSNNTQSNFTNFTLPNIGFVIHTGSETGIWNSSNWAIGLNRVADYNREFRFEGNTPGSIADSWRENAEGIDPDDLNGFEEGLAYSSGAIYDFENDNIYETDFDQNSQYPFFKKESAILTGGKTELTLAYGAEIDHKMMFGFSIGLPIVNYNQIRRYRESDEAEDAIPFFNELEYTNSLNSTGFGLNAKVGLTVKPTEFLNIALAFHSPTRLYMTDNFNTTLSYDFTDENNDGPIESESPYGSFQYALRTPWSVSGGLGIIAGKSGFLAAHAKFTDYKSMKYKYDVRGNGDEYEQIEREVNDDIKTIYGSSLQLNMGGELVLNTKYRVRGGITLQQSAFNNDNSFDPAFHAGIGYRAEYFYVDLGYKLSKDDEGYLPYETIDANQPLVVVDETKHQLAVTAGFKF